MHSRTCWGLVRNLQLNTIWNFQQILIQVSVNSQPRDTAMWAAPYAAADIVALTCNSHNWISDTLRLEVVNLVSVCQPLPPPNYHWALNHQAMLLINIYPNSTKMQSALWVQYWWSRSMVGGCLLLSLGASPWLGTGLTLAIPTNSNSNQPIYSKLHPNSTISSQATTGDAQIRITPQT